MERLVVPFEAITSFADPSAKFGYQFQLETGAASAEVPVRSSPAKRSRRRAAGARSRSPAGARALLKEAPPPASGLAQRSGGLAAEAAVKETPSPQVEAGGTESKPEVRRRARIRQGRQGRHPRQLPAQIDAASSFALRRRVRHGHDVERMNIARWFPRMAIMATRQFRKLTDGAC